MIKIFSVPLGGGFFSPKINERKSQNGQELQTFKGFGLNGKNLAPLAEDTLTFSGRKKHKEKSVSNPIEPQAVTRTRHADDKVMHKKERTITNVLSHRIYKEAEADTRMLKNILRNYLGYLVPTGAKRCSKEQPIHSLEFRTKGANSIREKATQKYLYSKEAVIDRLGDIVGARIILGENSSGSADVVIDKLIEAVKDGKIKITEVENHTPFDKRFQYVGQAKLHKLAQASSNKYGIFVNEKSVRNETGYTAVHLAVQFPDGYKGEIQILGRDVALLKELEDIPYKILQGKSVHKEYSEIVDILKPLCPVDDNPDNPENIKRAKLKKEFVAYTAAAYKYQRFKAPTSRRSALLPNFLTIDEYAKTQRSKIHLTPDMDFNNLYKLKDFADKRIKQQMEQ